MRLRAGFDRSRCDRIDARGYCYFEERVPGYAHVPFGISLGAVGELLPTDLQGLWSDRARGPHVDVGVLVPVGVDVRAWGGYERLRVGGMFQSGPVLARGGFERPGDAFERGSRVSTGWFFSVYAIAAYQAHFSDEVQLWLGGRAGAHFLGVPVQSEGRPYDSLFRFYGSVGPELGLRFSAGEAGVMLWGFADLLSPGRVQLTAAFVFETDKPDGAAF